MNTDKLFEGVEKINRKAATAIYFKQQIPNLNPDPHSSANLALAEDNAYRAICAQLDKAVRTDVLNFLKEFK